MQDKTDHHKSNHIHVVAADNEDSLVLLVWAAKLRDEPEFEVLRSELTKIAANISKMRERQAFLAEGCQLIGEVCKDIVEDLRASQTA